MLHLRKRFLAFPNTQAWIFDTCIYLGTDKTWGWDMYIGYTKEKVDFNNSNFRDELDPEGENLVGVVVCKSSLTDKGEYTVKMFNLPHFNYAEVGRVGAMVFERAKALGFLKEETV